MQRLFENVLVTGGAGYCGARLVPQLLASPSPPATLLWIAALALVLSGAALALMTSPPPQLRSARMLAALAAWDLVVPIIAAWAGADYLDTRNLIGALVPMLTLVGIGFASTSLPRAGLSGATLTAGVSLAATSAIIASPSLQRIDTKAAVASLGPPTVGRLVLAPGSYLFKLVLPRYLPGASTLTDSRVSVQEIDVLVPHPGPGTRPCLAGQTCQLFPTHEQPGAPAAGFQLVSSQDVVPFTVWRWRAPSPQLLQLNDVLLSAPQALEWQPLALYQISKR